MKTDKEILAFGPMEGITDATYRYALMSLYPQWDYFFTDFLRAPSSSNFPDRKIKEHVGEKILGNQKLLTKTIVQILSPPQANYEYLTQQLEDHGVPHLDLNLGCPSKTVYGHCGGSYLLDHPEVLKPMVAKIRKRFKRKFSIKMRLGVDDSKHFFENLKIFENEGVDLISIHGRTKAQLYKGVANWSLIKLAKQAVTKTPIWANGDIWTTHDLETIKQFTQADGFILSRGALRSPWFPLFLQTPFSHEGERLSFIANHLLATVLKLQTAFREVGLEEPAVLRRIKSLIHYAFVEFPNGDELKSKLLRSKCFVEFEEILDQGLYKVFDNRYSLTKELSSSKMMEPSRQ